MTSTKPMSYASSMKPRNWDIMAILVGLDNCWASMTNSSRELRMLYPSGATNWQDPSSSHLSQSDVMRITNGEVLSLDKTYVPVAGASSTPRPLKIRHP